MKNVRMKLVAGQSEAMEMVATWTLTLKIVL